MSNVVDTFFSLRFLLGFIAGVIAQRIWCHSKARWQDKYQPNQDGSKHPVAGLNKMWVAYAIVAIIIGSVVISTQKTYNLTQQNLSAISQLSADTQDCQNQFARALKARAEINKEEGEVNARWQNAQFELTSALNALLKRFGSSTNPEYQKAKEVVDEEYYRKTADIFQDRKRIMEQREENPYPEPTCGK